MPADVVRDGGVRILRALLGILVGAAAAAAVVLGSIASFGLNPVGPVLVALAAFALGGVGLRKTHDALLRGAALGLIVGALVAVLLWPLFAVDAGVLEGALRT